MRTADIRRDTRETRIQLSLNLDGTGKADIATGVGYLCGLAGKFISGNVTYVAAFYILDITMVTIDLVLTIRNKRLDRAAEKEETV